MKNRKLSELTDPELMYIKSLISQSKRNVFTIYSYKELKFYLYKRNPSPFTGELVIKINDYLKSIGIDYLNKPEIQYIQGGIINTSCDTGILGTDWTTETVIRKKNTLLGAQELNNKITQLTYKYFKDIDDIFEKLSNLDGDQDAIKLKLENTLEKIRRDIND